MEMEKKEKKWWNELFLLLKNMFSQMKRFYFILFVARISEIIRNSN